MADTFRIEVPIRVDDQTDPGVSRAKEKLNGFDKAAEKTKKRLDDMNKAKYQIVLEALDKASSIIGNVSTKARSLAGKTFSFTMKAIDMATAPLRGLLNFATSIRGIVTGVVAGLATKKLVIDPIGLSDSLTNANIAFQTMLGSADAAKKMMADIQAFAIKTPFNTSDVIQNTQMMMAYGFSAKDVIADMKIIGDMAAATGRGEEALGGIALALGQISSHGKVSAQDMNQLTNLGVKGWDYLAKALGKTKAEVMDLSERGLISADVGIKALLDGMKEYEGMMDKTANSTAKGLLNQLHDTFNIQILTRWGAGLQKGAVAGLKKISDWVADNQEKITEWGDKLEELGSKISTAVVSKVEKLQRTIKDMVNSTEWRNAENFGSKMKIAWNTIIAQPFMEWWNSTGKAWLADKASKIGEGIGSAISVGVLGLLGTDVSKATADGTSIGSAFASGFSKGFDGQKVGEAILNAIKGVFKDAGTLLPGGKEASSTSWLSAGAIGLGIAKLWPLLSGTAKLGSKAGRGIMNLFGKGSKSALPGVAGSALGGEAWSTSVMYVNASVVYLNGGLSFGGGGGKSLLPTLSGGAAALPRLTGRATQLALPAGEAVAEATAGASKTGIFSKIAGIFGKNGDDILKVGSKLGKGSKAIPIIGTVLGLAASGLTIANASPETRGKEAAGEVGSWLGAIGAGAGAGALVGTLGGGPVGTAVGAVVGGVGGAIGGEAFTEWLYDQKDAIGGFFTDTLPSAAGSAWGALKKGASDAGSWIADKWGGVSDWFGTNVWTPIKDVGISAINITAGIWGGVRDSISDKWSDFSGWFDSNVWQPVSGAAQVAASWLNDRWSEVSGWVRDRWADFSDWFGDNVWTPVTNGAQAAASWLNDRWGEVNSWVREKWGTLSSWFDETVWTPVKGAAQTAGAWLGDQFTAAKTAISEAWGSVSGWFEENVWGPIKGGATAAWNWVGDKLGGIGDWIGDKWTSFKDWLGKMGAKGSKETGLTTSTGKGSVFEHAYGGIMTKPHMGIVAEEGAEGIIPLSPSKRRRGIDLWQRTGELLGVRPYEEGGIVGDAPVAASTGGSGRSGEGGNLTVNNQIEPNITFNISTGADPKEVVETIRAKSSEIADILADDVAGATTDRLKKVYANMPRKAFAY